MRFLIEASSNMHLIRPLSPLLNELVNIGSESIEDKMSIQGILISIVPRSAVLREMLSPVVACNRHVATMAVH